MSPLVLLLFIFREIESMPTAPSTARPMTGHHGKTSRALGSDTSTKAAIERGKWTAIADCARGTSPSKRSHNSKCIVDAQRRNIGARRTAPATPYSACRGKKKHQSSMTQSTKSPTPASQTQEGDEYRSDFRVDAR